jgi:hypothetical protein
MSDMPKLRTHTKRALLAITLAAALAGCGSDS